MARKEIIYMSIRVLKRLKVIQWAMERRITQRAAASLIGVSERQVRRLVSRVREEGEEGIVHRGRGRVSNRRLSEELKEKVLSLYRKKYCGFGPLLATEKLLEMEGIRVSCETLRKWIIEAGLWEKRRKRKRARLSSRLA